MLRGYVRIVLYIAGSGAFVHPFDLAVQLLNASWSLGVLDTLGHTPFPLLGGL